ncbi:phosphatase PAP2 family protein [Candidatus Woesearchaeota archaeon]|nr:phosphatase PAP2 family protein [Candidatus Woesearchaeota archaeon]
MANKEALRNLFWAVSLFGTPFFYVPLAAYFLKTNSKLAISLIFILIFNEVICGAIKFIYPKDRPVPMPNKTFVQKYIAGSFPSVHTARIAAFSITVIPFYTSKVLVLAALLAIIGVGYSRIYLKKHYLVDVLAGFLIGAIVSILGLNIQF